MFIKANQVTQHGSDLTSIDYSLFALAFLSLVFIVVTAKCADFNYRYDADYFFGMAISEL